MLQNAVYSEIGFVPPNRRIKMNSMKEWNWSLIAAVLLDLSILFFIGYSIFK